MKSKYSVTFVSKCDQVYCLDNYTDLKLLTSKVRDLTLTKGVKSMTIFGLKPGIIEEAIKDLATPKTTIIDSTYPLTSDI